MVWTNKNEAATVTQANVCLWHAHTSISICKHQKQEATLQDLVQTSSFFNADMSVDRFAALLLHIILPLKVSVFVSS
jgi:hypothetical protein